jgi:hypothetical protein
MAVIAFSHQKLGGCYHNFVNNSLAPPRRPKVVFTARRLVPSIALLSLTTIAALQGHY